MTKHIKENEGIVSYYSLLDEMKTTQVFIHIHGGKNENTKNKKSCW
jgi:hypothetical protein